MTAEYEFCLSLTGTTGDLAAMLKVVRKYADSENDVYLEDIELSHNEDPIEFDDDFISLSEIDDNTLFNIAKEYGSPIEVYGWGPYGSVFMLNDADIFRELAEAAPGASFEGSIEGAGTYEEQNLNCSLCNGILEISTYYLENDMDEEDAIEKTYLYDPVAKNYIKSPASVAIEPSDNEDDFDDDE